MSKRFLRWVDRWIEDNVVPGAHRDVTTTEVKAAQMAELCLAAAAGEGFLQAEIDEEVAKLKPLMAKAVNATSEYQADYFRPDDY